MKALAKFIASGLGSGYSPIAPGTAGSLLASGALALLLYLQWPLSNNYLIAITILVTIVGIISCNLVEADWGKDPSKVVIDEIAGILVAVLFIPLTYQTILCSFVLFRVFDIWKPLGIRKMEDFKGGIGVMADDLLAGVYANVVLQLLLHFNFVG